jgi:hypothetical protein
MWWFFSSSLSIILNCCFWALFSHHSYLMPKCNRMQFFFSFFLDKPRLKWSYVYVFSSTWIRTTAITLLRSWVWHMGVAGRKSMVKLQVYDGDAKYGAIDRFLCLQNSTTF